MVSKKKTSGEVDVPGRPGLDCARKVNLKGMKGELSFKGWVGRTPGVEGNHGGRV